MAAHAQVFAPEGSKWWYCVREDLWPAPGYMNIHSEIISYWGDTLINGFLYKKIGNQLTREAGDTVFVFNGGQDYVLLNFSLQVGDTIRHLRFKTIYYDGPPGGSYMTFQITEKGKIEVQDDSLRYYRVIGIHTDFPQWDVFPPPLGIDGIFIEKMGLGGRLIEVVCPTCSPSNVFLLKYEYLDNPDYYYPNSFVTSCGWLDVEEQLIQTSVQVFPNPVSDVLNLEIIGSTLPVRIEISNMQGIRCKEVMPLGLGWVSFDVSQLSAGIYLIRLFYADGSQVTQKFIKH